ncbi:cache domain-containing sensor histidine kinase [Paenibacillus sp. y28]|uniref:cache domain-containing sensor histidine kinase n=1 Tax=Paenibacillus sp. y28 TaxID=3129110 RepID=UPI0030160582
MKRFRVSLRALYANWRIKHKISFLVSVIMIVAFVFTLGVHQYAFSIYDEQIYEKSSQVLNLSSTSIENELKKVEKLSFSMIADMQLQEALRTLKSGQLSDYERLRISRDITDRMSVYANTENFITSIQLLDYDGREYAAGNALVTPPDRKVEIDEVTKKRAGELTWIYPNDYDASLVAARRVRAFFDTNFSLDDLGTLFIRIDLEKVVHNVASGSERQTGEFVVTAGQEILFPRSTETIANLPELSDDLGRDYGITDLNGQKVFVASVQSSYTGWAYWNIIPFDRIFERITATKNLVFIEFIIIFGLVIALGMWFARSITKPVERLISKMRLVQKGEFKLEEPLPDPLPMDEVGLLHRTFHTMVQRIDDLITENYAKQLTIKETEFKALQAQINPHFLYNTLESINWMAKVNRQAQISNMVEALGFLLRNSISLKEPLITIDQELEIVKNYVTIQRYRFEERLDFRMEVPENLQAYCIPKLTLQPLLENAIHYGVEKMLEPCTITIRAAAEEDGLKLYVTDTGPGMTPEYLDKLRRREVITKGKGIGLSNIDDRIKIAFGDLYGMEIKSEAGRGTTVQIRLPYETRCRRV